LNLDINFFKNYKHRLTNVIDKKHKIPATVLFCRQRWPSLLFGQYMTASYAWFAQFFDAAQPVPVMKSSLRGQVH
jgi:hypothetical protein